MDERWCICRARRRCRKSVRNRRPGRLNICASWRSPAVAGMKTPGTRPGVSRLGVLQVGCRLFAALGHDLIRDALAFVERAHAGAFDRADMHEHILRAIARRDKSETLLSIEKLDC